VIRTGQRVAFVTLRLGLGYGAACGWSGEYRAHPACARRLKELRASTSPLPRSRHDEIRALGYKLSRSLGCQEPRERTRINRRAFEHVQRTDPGKGSLP